MLLLILFMNLCVKISLFSPPPFHFLRFLEALNSALNKYLSMISNVDLLRAVYSFCIMGYLPQPALDQLLCDEVLHDLVTSGQKLVLINALGQIRIEDPELHDANSLHLLRVDNTVDNVRNGVVLGRVSSMPVFSFRSKLWYYREL